MDTYHAIVSNHTFVLSICTSVNNGLKFGDSYVSLDILFLNASYIYSIDINLPTEYGIEVKEVL